jgi:hypothetical protein
VIDRASDFGGRPLVGLSFAQWDEPGGPASRYLACINLKPEIAVNHPFGPSGRADRPLLRIDSCDPGHEPICRAQIKTRVHAQRHDRSCCACSPDAGDDAEHAFVRVVAKIAVSLRERELLRQRQLLDPSLEFTRSASGVLAKHRDDDDFDWNHFSSLRGGQGLPPAVRRNP